MPSAKQNLALSGPGRQARLGELAGKRASGGFDPAYFTLAISFSGLIILQSSAASFLPSMPKATAIIWL